MDRCRQRQFLYGFIFLWACCMWTGCKHESDTPKVPGTPSSSDIQLTPSYDSITVSWISIANAYQYQVYYRKGSGSATLAGETVETSLTIMDLEANTLYYITVKAGNSEGWSSESSQKSVTTLQLGTASVRVTGKTASTVTLSWDQIPGAVRYKIYRGLGEGPASVVATVSATSGATCVWTDKGLSENTSYRYRVSAVIGTVEGEPSDWVSVTTSLPTPTSAPSGVTVSDVAATEILLTWDSLSGASSYYLYRSTSEEGTYTKVKEISETRVRDTELTPLTTYYYQVTGVNEDGEGPRSAPVSATTRVNLGTPSSISASLVSSTSITVSWGSVTEATGYTIYRSSSASGEYTLTGTGDSTSYTDTGLTPSTTYYYKVAAYNSVGDGPLSSSTFATTLFEAPTGVSATADSSSSITLSWNPVSRASSYYIDRSDSEGGTYTQVTYTSRTSYTDTGLSPGTRYYYKVRGRDASGYGDYSPPVSATTRLSLTVLVEVNDPEEADLSLQNKTLLRGETVTFEISGAWSSYQWYLNGRRLPITASSYTLTTGSMNLGIYEVLVVVTAANGEMRSGRCRITLYN